MILFFKNDIYFVQGFVHLSEISFLGEYVERAYLLGNEF